MCICVKKIENYLTNATEPERAVPDIYPKQKSIHVKVVMVVRIWGSATRVNTVKRWKFEKLLIDTGQKAGKILSLKKVFICE